MIGILLLLAATAHAAPPPCTPPTTHGPVTQLPTLDQPIANSWSGYAPVSSTTSLFYHITDAAAAPNATLLVWTNGGPGASSVAFGDFYQNIGPFHVDATTGNLAPNPNSFHAGGFATLFLDHPCPTGLSICCGDSAPGTQEANAQEYVAAVKLILRRHAQFATRDVYLCGESYAGRFVPAIATEMIAQGVTQLRGLLIGNGEVDAAAGFASYAPYLFANGWIAEPQRQALEATAKECSALVAAKQWAAATHTCYTIRTRAALWTNHSYWDYDIRYPAHGQPYAAAEARTIAYLDRADVRAALHAVSPSVKPVIEGAGAGGHDAWANFNATGDFCKSAVSLLPPMLEGGQLRVLIYTGQFDECMNVLSTENWLPTLAWPHTAAFVNTSRVAWNARGALPLTAGFWRRIGPLSQMIVLRAGHMATLEQPAATLAMYKDFVAGLI